MMGRAGGRLAAFVPTVEPPPISALSDGEPTPFWSVIVPTRDREQYLAETLESILSQAPGSNQMQIEVVDNYSTAVDVQALVRKIAADRIGYFRQPRAMSISENWTTCIRRAHGQWVHIMPDDDVLEPGFYDAYRSFIEQAPDLVLLACQARIIDEHGQPGRLRFNPPGVERTGVLQDPCQLLAQCDWIATPSAVVRRSAYERVGGFLGFSHILDWDMWMRLASIGDVGYIHRPLIRNREHSHSGSTSSFRTGRHIAEIAAFIDAAADRLQRPHRAAVRRKARRLYATYADYMSNALTGAMERRAALNHAVWAWRLHPGRARSLTVVRRLFDLLRSTAVR